MNRVIDTVFLKLGAKSKTERMTLITQFIKFCFVGLSNTLISWAIYYLFLWIDDNLYMVGSVLGGIVSIANAYFWNERFVFNKSGSSWKNKFKRLGKTYLSYGGTSLLSVVLLWVEVQLGVNKTIAPIVNLLITIPVNFLINKYWTFNSGDKK